MHRMESWHLFIAPMFLEESQPSEGPGHESLETRLQQAILKDSRFRMKERRFQVETPQDYSNYQYFFDDARRSIFWCEGFEDREGAVQFRLNVSDAPYEEADPQGIGRIRLRLFEDTGEALSVQEEVFLELMDVDITLYQFGVGHVSFLCRYRMEETGQAAEERFYRNVLLINDRVRRLYLPWLAPGVGAVGRGDLLGRKRAQVAGGAPYHELLVSIHPGYSNLPPGCPPEILEDYASGLHFETLNLEDPNRPILLEAALGQMDQQSLGCSFELMDDNRMFSVAYIQAQSLQRFLDTESWGGMEVLEGSQRWHRIITVDNAGGSQLTSFGPLRQTTVRESTYARWLDAEDPDRTTLYGCTRHSFVILGSGNNEYFTGNIRENFLHQYSEMARLVLAQSAAVHRFSRAIYTLSGKVTAPRRKRRQGLDDRVFREVTTFRQQFNDYINRLFFREVTPQLQGMDLYRMLQEHLQVHAHLGELRDELNQLFNHVEMLQRQSQEKSIHQLTQTTITLGVLGFVAAFYGANFIGMENGLMILDRQALRGFLLILAAATLLASFMPTYSNLAFAAGRWFRRLLGREE